MQVKKGHFQGASNIFGTGANSLADVLNSKIDRSNVNGIAAIADPATATAADVATKVNEILAALKTVPPEV